MPSPQPPEGPLVLLIEDDDPAVSGFLSRVLTNAGFRVATVDRLVLAPADTIAVILLDSGPTVAGLRQLLTGVRERWPLTPVLVLLASAEAEVWRVLSDAKAAVMAKPFRPGELIGVIQRLLDSPK